MCRILLVSMFVSLPFPKQQKSTLLSKHLLIATEQQYFSNNASVLRLLPLIYYQSFFLLLLLPSKSDPLTFSLDLHISHLYFATLLILIYVPVPFLLLFFLPATRLRYHQNSAIYSNLYYLFRFWKATNSTISTTKTPSFFLLVFHHFIDTSDGNVLKNKLLLFFFWFGSSLIRFLCLLSGRSKTTIPFSPNSVFAHVVELTHLRIQLGWLRLVGVPEW